jgi:hypothetical protein
MNENNLNDNSVSGMLLYSIDDFEIPMLIQGEGKNSYNEERRTSIFKFNEIFVPKREREAQITSPPKIENEMPGDSLKKHTSKHRSSPFRKTLVIKKTPSLQKDESDSGGLRKKLEMKSPLLLRLKNLLLLISLLE